MTEDMNNKPRRYDLEDTQELDDISAQAPEAGSAQPSNTPSAQPSSAQTDTPSAQPNNTQTIAQNQRPSIDYGAPGQHIYYPQPQYNGGQHTQYNNYAAQNPQYHSNPHPPAANPTPQQNSYYMNQAAPQPQPAEFANRNFYGATNYYQGQQPPRPPQPPYTAPLGQAAPFNPYSANAAAPATAAYGNIPNTAKEKKFPMGIAIFLTSAALVLVICIVLTVVVSLNAQADRSNNGDSGFSFELPTSPDDGYGGYDGYGYYDSFDQTEEDQDVLDDSDVLDTTDENGPQLELKSQPRDIFTNEAYTAKNSYDKAKESVVGIIAYNDRECTEIGSQGTGIIISEDGYIITNSHVIDDSRTRYKVRVTIDNEEYDAQVTGFDSRTDLAVLKIDKTGLNPAEFANSDELQVGQSVVAIGNPGGMSFSNSITQGIVSALDRDVDHGSATYIQTDAAINPGNSGGPLLNMDGQVVGITTVKIVNTSYEGMGFAIPSQQAASVIDSIIKYGYVEGRVRIGITGTEITSDYASYYDLPMGIYVASIDEDGPLADTELEVGDIITKIDDVEITNFSTMYKELDKHKPGDTVTLTCEYPLDEGGTEYEEYTIDVVLQSDEASK